MKNVSHRSFLQHKSKGAGRTVVATALPSFKSTPINNHENYDGEKLNIALCGLGCYAGYLAYGLEFAQQLAADHYLKRFQQNMIAVQYIEQ